MTLVIFILVVTLAIVLFVQLKYIPRRRQIDLDAPDLVDVPKFPINSKKMNFLDKRLNINPKSIELRSKGIATLRLNKEKDIWKSKTFGETSFDDCIHIATATFYLCYFFQ